MFGSKKEVFPDYPEVTNYTNAAGVVELAEKKLTEFIALLDGEGWNNIVFKETGHTDIIVNARIVPGESIQCQQAQGRLEASPQRMYDMAFSTDFTAIKPYDADILSINVLEEVNSDIRIYQSTHQTPTLVTSREFVALRCRKIVNGTMYVWGTSIQKPDVAQKSGHVRGVIAVSGWEIKPIVGEPNACMVRRVFQIDPKGSIPTIAINLFKTKAGLQLVAIRNYLKKNPQ
eukprot:TRINITY_DN5149_c0_g1_i1.p1 TRINITY_DN5149_c0_g1~~TRINITY_DN5149_c0_g1_i1.p1  ORF type:complete len:250 (-),score=120.33 TRINITY_DN5149_c0_g1_i1:82-774(-)